MAVLPQTTTTIDFDRLADNASQAAAGLWVMFAVLAILYWLPTVIAAIRGRNLGRVLVLNLLLGWTIVGWVVAMVIAWSKPARPQLVY